MSPGVQFKSLKEASFGEKIETNKKEVFYNVVLQNVLSSEISLYKCNSQYILTEKDCFRMKLNSDLKLSFPI